MVFLLRGPRHLTRDAVIAAVNSGLGIALPYGEPQDDGDGTFLVGDGEPSFIFQAGDRTILINNFPSPYVDDPEAAAAEVPELRLRTAMAEHGAWLSVDQLRPEVDDEKGLLEAYRTIGPLIAELADEDVLALLEPTTGRINVFDGSLLDLLRGPDPRRAFGTPTNVPVVEIKDDDPRMIAAVAQARARWPEFVAAFEDRRPAQNFSAKIRLAEGEAVEFLWITVTAVEGDSVYGTVDNDPIVLRKVRHGSRVRAPLADLNDRIYSEGKSLRGGFTVEVLRRSRGG